MSVNYVPIIFSLCGGDGGDDDGGGGVRVSVFYEHFLSNLLIWLLFFRCTYNCTHIFILWTIKDLKLRAHIIIGTKKSTRCRIGGNNTEPTNTA